MSKKYFKTYKGKRVSIDDIDHDHFSNKYWFHLIFDDKNILENPEWKRIYEEKFDKEILEYRPPLDFTFEINGLRKKGLLVRDGEDILIKYKGEIIGRAV